MGDTIGFGVRIAIANHWAEDGRPNEIVRIISTEDGQQHLKLEEISVAEMIEPTLTLPDDMARALLDALTRHYHGAEDTRALRRDYDDERKRVDKLTGALITVAGELAGVGE